MRSGKKVSSSSAILYSASMNNSCIEQPGLFLPRLACGVQGDGLMIPIFAISTTSDTSTLKRMCSQGFAHVFCKVILDAFV
jgi:hypothetical protein